MSIRIDIGARIYGWPMRRVARMVADPRDGGRPVHVLECGHVLPADRVGLCQPDYRRCRRCAPPPNKARP